MAKHKVLLAMSGGVDSSAAALILQKQGYTVIGLTLRFFDNNLSLQTESNSNNIDDINSARKFADLISIPHYVIDVSRQFKKLIINDFVEKYKDGITPNPCAKCNPEIKWHYLYGASKRLGCEYIATGHYANLKTEKGRFFINLPSDKNKDQSMFLWNLPQQILKKSIFPLSDYSKGDVKKMLIGKYKFITDRNESFNLCFIKGISKSEFLDKKIGTPKEGKVYTVDKTLLGTHKGIRNYTIGQRVENINPNYRVCKITPEDNSLVVDLVENNVTDRLSISSVNLMKYKDLPDNFRATVKIKYREQGTFCKLYNTTDGFDIVLEKNIPLPAIGQSVLIFEDNDMLGGGVIVKNDCCSKDLC